MSDVIWNISIYIYITTITLLMRIESFYNHLCYENIRIIYSISIACCNIRNTFFKVHDELFLCKYLPNINFMLFPVGDYHISLSRLIFRILHDR